MKIVEPKMLSSNRPSHTLSILFCRSPHPDDAFGEKEIVAGKRAVTADTDLRLCRFFGLSNGYWLRAQPAYDTGLAKESLSEALAKIKPWKELQDESNALHSRASR